MTRPLLPRLSIPLALSLAFAAACAVERDRERETGVHPDGFTDQKSPEFHGTALHDRYLSSHRYPLGECRQCHGDDYAGGGVGVSCLSNGCHTKGVEDCGTCHDGQSPPKPTSGSHAAHTFGCENCHDVPKSAREAAHPDGHVEVSITGLALTGPNAFPKWDPSDQRCSNTYCHGAESPLWGSPPAPLPCDSCHGAPPANHARFHVDAAPDGCKACHPASDGPTHLDGKVDFIEPTCNQCHGTPKSPSPPPALDGSMSPSSRGVGAHVRHLDATLSDRIGKALQCEDCHDIPATMRAKGHLDDSAPADVRLFGGSYDASEARCNVACHWGAGPVWTDTSGAARACDGCHAFPPDKTRAGTQHPTLQPLDPKDPTSIAVCRDCHHYETATHVDGHVDFLP